LKLSEEKGLTGKGGMAKSVSSCNLTFLGHYKNIFLRRASLVRLRGVALFLLLPFSTAKLLQGQ
jgi:hypothetical protein